MNISNKLLKAAAGQASGAGLDVTEVFSTFLYTGSSSAQTINNGIDLSGEGGLVWIKERSTSGSENHLTDTVRGIKNPLNSDSTAAENSYYANNNLGITAFNNNGFTVASGSNFNDNGDTAVSWTFRKAPKFFDVVTYTGNFTAGRTISHNLGSVPGMILIKKRSTTSNWFVYHRSTGEGKFLKLNEADPETSNTYVFDNTAPTSTEFTIGEASNTNANGVTYVAYLFAHNNNDGGFGPDGDQDIIKCGSYTGAGSPYTGGSEIDLGFEPQFVLIKSADHSKNWVLIDNMRGWDGVGGKQNWLYPNTTGADNSGGTLAYLTSTGFKPYGSSFTNHTGTFIYMAIRRGPLAKPTDATKVFAVQDGRGASKLFTAGFPIDMFLMGDKNGDNWQLKDRLRAVSQQDLTPNSNAAESENTFYYFDDQTGLVTSSGGGSALAQLTGYMWKRAPGYFDVVAYSGSLGASNFSGTTSINHNLGVTPEMIWIKSRSNTPKWCVGSTHFSSGGTLALNETAALEGVGNTDRFVYADWSSTVFKVGNNDEVNRTGYTYIAYLFATLAGISKCGSYTGNGSTQNIDCGFAARFVLLKRTDSTEDWTVFDSVRGITTGSSDKGLNLNLTDAQFTESSFYGNNVIQPHSSGFTVLNHFATNGRTYLFYAIA